MLYANCIGYAIAAVVHNGFRYPFLPASPFHTQQVCAGTVGNVVIKILTIREHVVIITVALQCIGPWRIKVLHQHKFKIFTKGFDHRLFVHLAENIMHFECIFIKPEIEEFESCFAGKNHSYAAVGHGLDNEQTAQVLTRNINLGIV